MLFHSSDLAALASYIDTQCHLVSFLYTVGSTAESLYCSLILAVCYVLCVLPCLRSCQSMTSLFSNTVSPVKEGTSSLSRRSSTLSKPPLRALYDLLIAPMEGVRHCSMHLIAFVFIFMITDFPFCSFEVSKPV